MSQDLYFRHSFTTGNWVTERSRVWTGDTPFPSGLVVSVSRKGKVFCGGLSTSLQWSGLEDSLSTTQYLVPRLPSLPERRVKGTEG